LVSHPAQTQNPCTPSSSLPADQGPLVLVPVLVTVTVTVPRLAVMVHFRPVGRVLSLRFPT
jgi:hypothetical protein